MHTAAGQHQSSHCDAASHANVCSQLLYVVSLSLLVLQTWQRVRRRGKVLHTWENKHVLKCELDDAVVRKARQKRRAPPVAAVNQLAWSYDDLLVCACIGLS